MSSCRHINEPDEPVGPGEISFGNALPMNGLADYVRVPHASDLSLSHGSFTVEAWVQPGNFIYYKWIVAKAASNASLDYLLGFDVDGRFRFITRNLSNDIKGRLPEPYRWYHVAGVQDVKKGKVYLYVDGHLEAAVPLRGTSGVNNAELLLGNRIHTDYPGVLAEYLDGNVDDVRIWNKALSHNQIKANSCKPLKGNESGLVAYWNFDESSGTAVYDATDHGHDGTSVSPLRIPSTVPDR